MKQKETKKNNNTFYSAKGVILMVCILLVLTAVALCGMYTLGVIHLPKVISGMISVKETTAPPSAVDILADTTQAQLSKALPREEYASALAGMPLPDEYYRNYTVTVYSGKTSIAADYYTVFRKGEYFVQKKQDGRIVSTSVCKGDTVTITDNLQNKSVNIPALSDIAPNGATFAEVSGVLPLDTIVGMISKLEQGETVDYGGGITAYSLSFTPARGNGENQFTFSFTCSNGVREEYSFAFESALILSVKKYYGGTLTCKIESKTYANDLTGVNADQLFS